MENILPETVPALDERECSLINLYRTLSNAQQEALLKFIFTMALNSEYDDKKPEE